MADGWRGTKLGYAGGRTGWLGNYGNNDSLRGTRGAGYSFNNMGVRRDTVTTMVTAVGLIGGLYVLAEYRGRNKLIKAMKKVTKPVGQPLKKGIDNITG